MPYSLLHIRSAQAKHYFKAAGPALVFILVAAGALLYFCYGLYSHPVYAMYCMAFIYIACWKFHLQRRDKLFVYTHLPRPYLELYSEYFVFTLPLTLPCIVTAQWWWFPVFSALLLLLPLQKKSFTQKAYFKNISRLIPAPQFEIISGFRKSFGSLILLYAIALAFSGIQLLPLFLLWFLSIMIVGFYSVCEPLNLLQSGSYSNSSTFLRKKVSSQLFIYFICYLPIILIHAFSHPEWFWVSILWLPSLLCLIAYSIFLKYSLYTPGKIINSNNPSFMLIAFVSLIPFLLPVGILSCWDYAAKARKNLSTYIHD